jgi:hypothetical protein
MGYVVAGYGVTLLGLGAYAAWVVRRATRLSRPVKGGRS